MQSIRKIVNTPWTWALLISLVTAAVAVMTSAAPADDANARCATGVYDC